MKPVEVVIDLHGFRRTVEMIEPLAPMFETSLVMRLRAAVIEAETDMTLAGAEEVSGLVSMRFRRRPGPDNLYVCHGCVLCNPRMTDTEIIRLAQSAARAAVDEYEAMKRAIRIDRRRRAKRKGRTR